MVRFFGPPCSIYRLVPRNKPIVLAKTVCRYYRLESMRRYSTSRPPVGTIVVRRGRRQLRLRTLQCARRRVLHDAVPRLDRLEPTGERLHGLRRRRPVATTPYWASQQRRPSATGWGRRGHFHA